MATSARFGRVGGGDPKITVRFEAGRIIHLTDATTRKFLGGAFQHALANAHSEAAEIVQGAMAKALTKAERDHAASTGRYRPQRPGDRLLNSILDERNREVTASTWRVGIPSWYEKSPAALYWRQIEEGGRPYRTTALFTNAWPGATRFFAPAPAPTAQMRMPQLSRGAPILVQGTPRYAYNAAGARAAKAIDYAALYRKHLKPIGLEAQIRS